MKTQTNPSARSVTGKLLAFAAVGAYFAVLFVGGLLNYGKTPVIAPDFIIYLNPLTYGIAWLVLTAVLLAYGMISKPVVYGFAWVASLCYSVGTAVSGGSYYLTFALCALMAGMTYACGWALRSERAGISGKKKPFVLSSLGGKLVMAFVAALAGGGVLFLLLSSYLSYTTSPSVSTGVYIQLMESLRSGFSFDTTLEFGAEVSHLAAHISPIFLVYLPFYAVIPSPVTLMVLQVLAVYSAVIPLWLIARRKGLSPVLSALLCGLLCLFPLVWGGTAGSFHEYALLLPLLLWLLWSFEAHRRVLPWVFAALVLCVRETCAIHLFTVGVYWLLTNRKAVEGEQSRKAERVKSVVLMGVSALYFVIAMAVLTYAGKGTLITRFSNVTGIYSTDFATLIRELLYNPALAVYEMLTEAKLHSVLCTVLPLGLIPLFSKKKAGLVFLLPYLLLNLLSDFSFHYSPDFPYSFGVSALALYLCADTLGELAAREDKAVLLRRLSAIAVCCTLIIGGFRLADFSLFTSYSVEGKDEVAEMTELLSAVEDGASVSASARLVPNLAAREEVYYLHQGQTTEFVVIDLREEWAVESDAKYDEKYYTDKGYTVVKRCVGVGVVLRKSV